MANYANAKATIAANVYQNNNNEVTANMVKAGINSVVDTLISGGYLYAGIAHPDDAAVTPDANVFYIASEAGTYVNKGGIVVADGEVAVLKYNGTWSKEITGAATAAQVTELGQQVYAEKIIDLSGFNRASGIATSNVPPTWNGVSSPESFNHIAIPNDGYATISIKANSTNPAQVAFVKSYNVVQGAYLDMCTGETARHDIAAGTTGEFTIPTDCAYIIVNMNVAADYSPESITVISGLTKVEQLGAIVEKSMADIEIDANIFTDSEGIASSNTPPQWSGIGDVSAWSHIVIPNYGYLSLSISANNNAATQIAFVKSYTTPVYGASLDMCEGETARHDIAAGASSVLVVPTDCVYIILNSTLNSVRAIPASLSAKGGANALYNLSDSETESYKKELSNDGGLINNSVGENLFANGLRSNLKILCYGNSFMLNTAYYLSSIAKGCGVNLIVGDLYIGGVNMSSHYNALVANSSIYGWRKWVDGIQTVDTFNVAPMTALLNERWDAIVVHQYRPWDEPFEPILNKFINLIVERIGYCPKIYINSTWAKHEDVVLERDGFETEEEMWRAMLDACKGACKDSGIKEFNIIPTGTAIQNARTLSWADDYNRFCQLYDNDGTSIDKSHLNIAGGFIAACTVFQKIVTPLNGISCDTTTFRITQPAALPPASTPMDTLVTDSNYLELCNAAIAAVNSPDEITQIN